MIREFRFRPDELTHVEMTPEEREKHGEKRISFIYETYYIESYLEGYLKRDKAFKEYYKNTPKEDKILIVSVRFNNNENSVRRFKDARSLVLRIKDNRNEAMYTLRGSKRAEVVLCMIEDTLNELDKHIPMIKTTLQKGIEEFRSGGYKNVWTHKKKRMKGVGIVKLACELTQVKFILSLELETKDEIYKTVVYEKEPQDIIFYHYKNLVFDGEKIMITERVSDKPFYEITVDDLMSQKAGKYLKPSKQDGYNDIFVRDFKPRPTWQMFIDCLEETNKPCPDFDG